MRTPTTAKLFTSADLEAKRHFLGSTFPEKLVYSDKAYRTANEENVVLLIARAGKGLKEKKEGKQGLFCFPSRRVVLPGIEPGSGASETHILSIVLQDQLWGKVNF